MSQQQIRAWLDRHPEALPRTLDELQLWREHLETFLQPELVLNEPQRRMVETTIPRLPELLAAPAA